MGVCLLIGHLPSMCGWRVSYDQPTVRFLTDVLGIVGYSGPVGLVQVSLYTTVNRCGRLTVGGHISLRRDLETCHTSLQASFCKFLSPLPTANLLIKPSKRSRGSLVQF